MAYPRPFERPLGPPFTSQSPLLRGFSGPRPDAQRFSQRAPGQRLSEPTFLLYSPPAAAIPGAKLNINGRELWVLGRRLSFVLVRCPMSTRP